MINVSAKHVKLAGNAACGLTIINYAIDHLNRSYAYDPGIALAEISVVVTALVAFVVAAALKNIEQRLLHIEQKRDLDA